MLCQLFVLHSVCIGFDFFLVEVLSGLLDNNQQCQIRSKKKLSDEQEKKMNERMKIDRKRKRKCFAVQFVGKSAFNLQNNKKKLF